MLYPSLNFLSNIRSHLKFSGSSSHNSHPPGSPDTSNHTHTSTSSEHTTPSERELTRTEKIRAWYSAKHSALHNDGYDPERDETCPYVSDTEESDDDTASDTASIRSTEKLGGRHYEDSIYEGSLYEDSREPMAYAFLRLKRREVQGVKYICYGGMLA
ncbi:hypothetical protein BJ508DRAFT_21571 [Ascobolus immersus RN42]|uniref:Uncharacterized protein n=1 Tax=Ascobolus immersus RN42 TaxID=1160509 RepID=A0A3N4HR19_ASCIM|nr:hypothetical protein BJ508DRAFT_21571 [Ascobolus immersus RN42]